MRFEKFTDRVRSVVDFASAEAERLGHSSVDTVHLLLGLIREEDGTARAALVELNVRLGDVREAILKLDPEG